MSGFPWHLFAAHHSAPRSSRATLVVSALLTLVTILALACSPQPQAAGKQRLVVALQPTLAASDMLEKAKPLEEYLEARLPQTDVEIYVPLSQAGVIEAVRFGQAHVAFMGAWPAQLAVQLADAELPLAEVREVLQDGRKVEAPYYFSYWVVPRESPEQSLEQLRGKRACFPSPVSGSGYVGPMGRMIELGYLSRAERSEVDPKGFFGEVIFGGGYAQCWTALQSRQVDVTVIAGDVPETLYIDVLNNTRVLEQQGPLPSHGVVFSKELKEPLRSQVIAAVVGLSSPEYRELMRGFISGIFVGFQKTNAETHLGPFKGYLDKAGLAFIERIAS